MSDLRAAIQALADEWEAESARYIEYAEKATSIEARADQRAIGRTLQQDVDKIRAILAAPAPDTDALAERDAKWGDVLQSPADVWEIGRNAGVLDALREHGPEGQAERLLWVVMTPRTDENPYAEAGDRIALIEELDALLDDCDQRADTPEDPNLVKVWAVRQVTERYGGKEHRWPYPTQPAEPTQSDAGEVGDGE